jgi:hypothetical protein
MLSLQYNTGDIPSPIYKIFPLSFFMSFAISRFSLP